MEVIIHLNWLPEKTTIKSYYYVEELKELRQATKHEKRGKLTRSVLLQHGNSMPHVRSKTMAAIDDSGIKCLPQPPYSTDLAPSGYWLFGKMKKPFEGRDLKILNGWTTKYNSSKKVPLKNYMPLC